MDRRPLGFASIARLARFALLALLGACNDSTAPQPLDAAGVDGELEAAAAAVSAPATLSVAVLGSEIDLALADLGGGAALVDLPAALIADPKALLAHESLRARVQQDAGRPSLIPAAALGKTFEYDLTLERYVMGERTGAPADGVRFILYAIDELVPGELAEPLVEIGHVDLTRTVVNQVATARVRVYGGVATPVKVMDYSVSLQGPLLAPNVFVSGFARNGTDSLTFGLSSTLAIVAQVVTIDWLAEVPTRGLSTHVQTSIVGPAPRQVTLDGLLASPSGRVRISGTIQEETGGTLVVRVNGDTFATIAVDYLGDETPTILDAGGSPLTEAEQAMLRRIISWFDDARDLFEDLLDPVEELLDIAF